MKLSINLKHPLLIWASTCLLASCFHWANQTTGHGVEKILLISLVCSVPALVLLVPVFHILQTHIPHRYRIGLGCLAILVLGTLVTMVFWKLIEGFPIDKKTFVLLIAPYFASAELSFFMIARVTTLMRATSASKDNQFSNINMSKHN